MPTSNRQQLETVISQILSLLREDGETNWRRWLEEVLTRLGESDYSGIEYFLSAYGGMGSFNDLVIGQTTTLEGRFISWKPGAGPANERLSELRSAAWQLARDIQRNHEIAER